MERESSVRWEEAQRGVYAGREDTGESRER